MALSSKSFACIEIGSVAVGYAALAKACGQPIEVIEASVVGGARFMILLRAEEAALNEAVLAARDAAIRGGDGDAPSCESEVLPREPDGLVDALYSLASQGLAESLAVCETGSMSAMLTVAGAMLGSAGVRAIEIKPLRGPGGGALGFFTGPSEEIGLAAETARSRLKTAGRSGRIETIDAPCSEFRAFFNLSGEA